MKSMLKFNLTLFILASVIFTFTGCDKSKTQKSIRDFREKSAELSTYGGKLTKAFGDAYKAGEITQEQLAALNVATGAFTTGVGFYREAVAEAERVFKETGELPVSTINALSKIVNDRLIAAFFDVLVKVGVLPVAQSEVVKTVISSIRLLLLAIQAAIADVRNLVDKNKITEVMA